MASGTVSFGGLSSGMDTEAIISALMKIERQPYDALQSRMNRVDSAKIAVNSFSNKLSNLNSAAKALSTLNGFSSMGVTSSDTSIVATATGAASAGAFDVQVVSLAREQRTYSDAQTSDTTALGISGTLNLAVGSATATPLTIDATDSLANIATKINAAGLRVSASVLSTSAGYKLQVRGMDTGTANAVTIGETGFSLGLSTPANTYQKATDAKLIVDGSTLTRSTNSISDAITGVTLALTKETTSATTVTIAPDPNGLTAKLNTFISAYNDVISSGQSAIGYGSIKPSNTELAGDTAIRTSMAALSTQITTPTDVGTSVYSTLGSVGVSITRDGKLTLDSAKLTKALNADAAGVARLFTGSSTTTGIMSALSTKIATLTTDSNAVIQTRLDSFDRLRRRLDDDSTSYAARLDRTETALRAQFTNLETVMSKYKSALTQAQNLPTKFISG